MKSNIPKQHILQTKKAFSHIYKYSFLFLGLFIIYLYSTQLPFLRTPENIMQFMRISLISLILIEIVLFFTKKASIPQVLFLILTAGIIMRVGYTLYTPYFLRAHDLGMPLDDTSRGHINYIYYIYSHHALPDNNEIQFYQPPLFHILCALLMEFYHFLRPAVDSNALFDSTKLVSCFASICSLIAMKKILEELRCPSKGTILALGIAAFFPNYYLMAGRVNNDSLSFLFIVLSLLYIIRWGREHKKKDLFLLALWIGLGMMTKLSVGTVAVIAAPLMLYYLWKQYKEGYAVKTLLSYVVFLLICAPLGLWHSIRNFVLFGQPIGYVLNITEYYGVTTLYRGNLSLWERFFSFPLKDISLRPFIDVNVDSNINTYILRCSLFGEFSFANLEKLAKPFILINGILILLSLLAGVYILLIKNKNKWLRFGPALVWLLFMVSYYSFNLKYPESCTMDYRYIPITAFCGSICIGNAFSILSKRRQDAKQNGRYAEIYLNAALQGFILLAVTAFIVCSVLFYTAIQ